MPILHPDDHVDSSDYAALLTQPDDRATPPPVWYSAPRFVNSVLGLAVAFTLGMVLLSIADHASPAHHRLWVALTVAALALVSIGAYAFIYMVETVANEHATDANNSQPASNAQQQAADPPAEMWHRPHHGKHI